MYNKLLKTPELNNKKETCKCNKILIVDDDGFNLYCI